MTQPDPIGVSGPGAMSQRVDKQPMRAPAGMPYGEAGALMDAQRQQPLPQTPQIPSIPVTGLDAPTASPEQPVTAGAAAGPGPGPEALSTAAVGAPAASGAISQALARVAASDNSGVFAQLLAVAQSKGL